MTMQWIADDRRLRRLASESPGAGGVDHKAGVDGADGTDVLLGGARSLKR